ncbi:MAG: hypothetical protein EOP38_15465 [Rubrivivax sp.]|nr:MAG: hypothetical protein EOP38_15465 [Rubrivivax sp.]
MDKEEKGPSLKELMPTVADMVQRRRIEEGGAWVTEMVNRGMRGEPNCFYAFERGHVVGTPFDPGFYMEELARTTAAIGGVFMVMRGINDGPYQPGGKRHGED